LASPGQGDPAGPGPDGSGLSGAPGSVAAPAQVVPSSTTRRTAARTAVSTLVVVGITGGVYLAWSIRAELGTIFIGFFLALGFDPVVTRLTRPLRRRGAAVLVVVLVFFLLLVLFVTIVVTPAITQLGDLGGVLTREVPLLVRQAQDSHTRLGQFARRPEVAQALQSLASSLPTRIASSVNGVLTLVGSIFTSIFAGLSVLALTIYFLLAMPRIMAVARAALGGGVRAAVLDEAASKVGGYVLGQLTVCLTAGVTAGVFFFATGVPYAIILALAVALLDAVPQIGATAGAVVGTATALTVSYRLALVTLVFFVAYQQTENYLIAPRLMSRSINVSAAAVLIAVLVGGGIGGVVGALVALPVTAAMKTVLAHAYGARLRPLGVDLATPSPAGGGGARRWPGGRRGRR